MKIANRPTAWGLWALLLCCAPLFFAACSEEDDTVEEFANWQSINTQYWDSLYSATQANISNGDSSWRIYRSWSISDSTVASTYYIIVHVQTEGTGSGCPLYTDSVRVNYYGRLLPSASYPEGYLFDSSYSSDFNPDTSAPAQFLVSSLTDGFATALQHMYIGDEWDVYIPWPLGYGETGTSSSSSSVYIPGYSVLKFHINLVSYYRAGTDVPDFSAKEQTWTVE
jgi:FKBP-type peptidyl-prolyl cis-trans isomerase FklB